jgi:hypothetical protein
MLRKEESNGAVILLLTLTMAAPIAAQNNNQATFAKDAGTPVSTETKADALQDSAAKWNDQPARYSEAAALYRQSAALRSWADPRAVEALAKAAHLYGYANRLSDARKIMEQAAQRALAGGDVVRASQANLDAAFFAQKQGNKVEVDRLGRTALRLAESPLISADQKELILRRVKSSPAVAGKAEAKANIASPDGQ